MPKQIKKKATKSPAVQDIRENKTIGIIQDFYKEGKKNLITIGSLVGAVIVLYFVLTLYNNSLRQEAYALELEEVVESGFGLGDGGGVEQFVGLEVVVEGEAGEGEVTEVHQLCSGSGSSLRRCNLRRASAPVGSGGGVSGWRFQDGRCRLTKQLA